VLKTKHLIRQEVPSVTHDTLSEVAVVGNAPETREEELWHLLGRHEALTLHAAWATATWAANLAHIRESKLYLLQEKDWRTWCQKHTPFSRRTADRIIEDFREFGRWGFVARELLGLSREAFRTLRPEMTETGEMVIGDQRFPLTKANLPEIQAAIKHILEERRLAEEREKELKQEKDRMERQRDAAREEAKRVKEELERWRRQREELFADAGPVMKQLLEAQSNIVMAVAKISAAKKKSETETDKAAAEGLIEYGIKALLSLSDQQPQDLFLSGIMEGRDLMQEYLDGKERQRKEADPERWKN